MYGFSYWLPLLESAAHQYLSPDAGWHAQVSETSIMLAIRLYVVKMENATNRRVLRRHRGNKGEVFLSEIVEVITKTIEDIESAFRG